MPWPWPPLPHQPWEMWPYGCLTACGMSVSTWEKSSMDVFNHSLTGRGSRDLSLLHRALTQGAQAPEAQGKLRLWAACPPIIGQSSSLGSLHGGSCPAAPVWGAGSGQVQQCSSGCSLTLKRIKTDSIFRPLGLEGI